MDKEKQKNIQLAIHNEVTRIRKTVNTVVIFWVIVIFIRSIIYILDESYDIDVSRATIASNGVECGKQVSAKETYFAWL